MRNRPTPEAQANARTLRLGMTDSERRLWSRIRSEQLGVKFRRQHPLGNYIADFACLDPKLIIELDGSQHAEQAAYDAIRDQFFRSHGFAVLRFASNEPLLNPDGVLAVIAAELFARAVPPSQPSPEGGRGQNPRSIS
jgi:very-short-patch-repair endonuclease